MKNNLLKTTCAVFSLLSTALFALPQQLYAQSKEAYVEKNLNEKVMTFYYDDQKSSRKGIVYSINEKQKTESEQQQSTEEKPAPASTVTETTAPPTAETPKTAE